MKQTQEKSNLDVDKGNQRELVPSGCEPLLHGRLWS